MCENTNEQLKQNLIDAARKLRIFQLAEIRVQSMLDAAQAKLSDIRAAMDQAGKDLHRAKEARVFAEFGWRTLLQEQEKLRLENAAGIACAARRAARDTLMLSCVNVDDDAIVQAALSYGERKKEYDRSTDFSRRINEAVDAAYEGIEAAQVAGEDAQSRLDESNAAYTATLAEIDATRAALPSKHINENALHDAVQAAAHALCGIPYEQYHGWYKLDSTVVRPAD